MRDLFTTIGELVGALVFCFGLALIAPAIAVMAFGLLVVLFSWMAAR